MNDAGLSKYYYGSTYQHAELSTPIHMWEHDVPTTLGGSYVSGVNAFFEDEPIFFPNNAQQHTPGDVPAFAVLEPQLPLPQAAVKESTTFNDSTSIPFVQIHATNLEPPVENYHNVFRRKTEVIKAEPIKSEATDAAKDRVNATPTPPARNASCSSIDGKANLEIVNGECANNATTHATLPVVHKCSTCPFMSLSQAAVSSHIASAHTNVNEQSFRPYISCPGCENTFYSYNSLDVHLREDHMMISEDIAGIMLALHQEKTLTDATNSKVPENAQFDDQSKSEIFLQNVNCLTTAPSQVDVIEPKTQLGENMLETNNNNVFNLIHRNVIETPFQSTIEPIQSKQKISIKSVDVLRDPVPIAVDTSYINNINSYHQQPTSNANVNVNINAAQENSIIECGTADNLETIEKPRRPKIYIKNVDILKEPMLLPRNLNIVNLQNMNFSFGGTQNATNEFENNNTELLPPITESYEENIQNLSNMRSDAFLFESTMPNNRNNANGATVNMLGGGGGGGDFLETFVSNTSVVASTNSNFTLDNNKFANDLDMNLLSYTNTANVSLPIVTETTPPPPPMITTTTAATTTIPLSVSLSSTPDMEQPLVPLEQNLMQSNSNVQKQKIFIKNVDILKAPQVHNETHQQHQRGTLHLRTVDELNLMNRNEVENLLVPNVNGLPAEVGIECTNISVPALSDFGPDFPHSWSNEDYDLGEDLDCIITDSIEPLINISKAIASTSTETSKDNIDTNIHEVASNPPPAIMPEIDSLTQMAEDILNENFTTLYNLPNDVPATENTSKLELTLDNATIATPLANLASQANVVTNVLPPTDLPPLVPVTSTTSDNCDPMPASIVQNLTNIPVPPLVPCAPALRPLNNKRDDKTKCSPVSSSNSNSSSGSGEETGSLVLTPTNNNNNAEPNALSEKNIRIFVANNLHHQESSESTPSQELAGGTSVRGRPYGAKRTGITKLRKQSGIAIEAQVGIKCSVNGCAFRFKVPETLEYHKRCHNSESNSSQAMICPECKSTEFNNWNSLHTHLWRSHQIDMELYRCPQCAFRTPIYSRLINTHSKIHSEERNYKCEQCGKAFKNTKQLKNHRRWHRNQGTHKAPQSLTVDGVAQIHRCDDCGATFAHSKSLREHLCKNREEQLQCEFCQRQMSSKSSLKLHLLTHESEKRFKCVVCGYEANDHNAFRRHRMTHLEATMYACPFCKSKFIQSCAYQRHIQQKHPKHAADIVYKCTHCVFTTINRSLLLVHQAKHAGPVALMQPNALGSEQAQLPQEEDDEEEEVEIVDETQITKIKVKSNLLLTHSSDSSLLDVSEDLLNSLLIAQENGQH